MEAKLEMGRKRGNMEYVRGRGDGTGELLLLQRQSCATLLRKGARDHRPSARCTLLDAGRQLLQSRNPHIHHSASQQMRLRFPHARWDCRPQRRATRDANSLLHWRPGIHLW